MMEVTKKLPGGCYLEDRDRIEKINIRKIDVLPFQKYRFDVIDDDDETEEQELSWHEALMIFTAVGTLIMAGLATGWMSFLIMAIGFVIVTILVAVME